MQRFPDYKDTLDRANNSPTHKFRATTSCRFWNDAVAVKPRLPSVKKIAGSNQDN